MRAADPCTAKCPSFKVIAPAIAVALIASAFCPSASAGPQRFGDNEYLFVAVTDPFTGMNNAWVNDSLAAAASVFNGVQGHLATVSTQAESDFLFGLAHSQSLGFEGAWLGGSAAQGWLVGPEAGQPFTYTNWGGVEPNNQGYLYMNIGASFAGIGPGQWVDDSGVQGVPDPHFDPVTGYFIEYERAALVPEPSTTTLSLLGLAILLRIGASSSIRFARYPRRA